MTALTYETTPCPVCQSVYAKPLFTGEDLLYHGPGRFPVKQCTGCGLIRTDPRPTRECIGYWYPEAYGPYATSSPTRASSASRLGRIKRAISEWTLAEALPEGLTPETALELGCGSGRFVAELQQRGWQAEGIEFSEYAVKQAQAAGLPVLQGDVSRPQAWRDNLQHASYRLLVAWMVLEHLHDPVETLQQWRDLAQPGAWLALSVPNAASLDFKLFRRFGYALQVPTHLFHYTPHTIDAVLQAGGWAPRALFHQRNAMNLVGSLGLALRSKFLVGLPENQSKAALLAKLALLPLAGILGLTGQSGRMTVWAQRKD